MKKNILAVIEVIILVLGLVGLNTIFHGCSGEMAVRCADSIHVTELLFASGILISILEIVFVNKEKCGFIIGKIVIFADTVLVPAVVVKGCKMAEMSCRAKAFPFIYVVGAVLIIINFVKLFLEIRKK